MLNATNILTLLLMMAAYSIIASIIVLFKNLEYWKFRELLSGTATYFALLLSVDIAIRLTGCQPKLDIDAKTEVIFTAIIFFIFSLYRGAADLRNKVKIRTQSKLS